MFFQLSQLSLLKKPNIVSYYQTERKPNSDDAEHKSWPNDNDNKLNKFEQWLVQETKDSMEEIVDTIKQGPEKYEITGFVILWNEFLKSEFINKHQSIEEDFQNSKLLYKATSLSNISSIFAENLRYIGKSSPGWYGQ